ncbi:MAG: 23S rRNA (guanosine(2251)-2'-O)-methyltransferase RlmB [Coriobacteriales bacterium]|nr:23S rRNA (guanosine(2251)-2'-O)-methyltransferase RlmB [Coriobacteriales bacterium]
MSDWRKKSKQFESADSPQSLSYNYATLDDLIKQAQGKKSALIVVLDHITDVGNLGAIIRSAEVIGAAGVVIPSKRAAQVNDGVYRASAGAIDYMKVAREPNLATALKRLKDEGFWVGGATEHAKQTIWQAPLEGRIVLVMGAEDTGLARLTRELCDFEFKLPQVGVTSSLNVAQAFTAIAYEWLRRSSN